MKPSLVRLISFVVAFFMFILLITLEYRNYTILEESIVKNQHDRLEAIMDTVTPTVALNMSLGLNDSVRESMVLLQSKNPSIITIKVYDSQGEVIHNSDNRKYVKKEFIISKKKSIINNIGFGDERLGSIVMEYYSEEYENLLDKAKEDNIIFFTIFLVIIAILSFIIKNILKPLEELSIALKGYKPNNDFKIELQSNYEEIVVIKETINSLLQSVFNFTKELYTLNATLEEKVEKQTVKLVEMNRDLQKRVDESVDEIREKDKMMVKQAQLAQMGEMISMIAHQWKQPLATISAITSNIKLKRDLGNLTADESYTFMLEIEERIKYLANTVDDFRTFFKPDKEKETFDIKDVIEESISLIRPEIKEIEFVFNYETTKKVISYRNELLQVILNILKNANDVMKERDIGNKKITIFTYERKEYIVLTIEDNGGGVSNELIHKIFEPYFTTKDEKNGTGLGMYMSKVIIEEHCNGILRVENAIFGAKFTIMLPK